MSSFPPGASLTYFNDGKWGLRDFFGSEILAKSDGLSKIQGFFWVAKKTQGFCLGIVFSSAQINSGISAIYFYVVNL